MKIKKLILPFIFLLSVLPRGASASNSLWLQADKYEPAKSKPTTLSLSFGNFPKGNMNLDRGELWVILPDGSIDKPTLFKEGGKLHAKIKIKYGGLYTAIALYKKQRGNRTVWHYAKLQFNRFGREVKEKKVVDSPSVPLEINPLVKLHMHRRLNEGDKFNLKVLYKGKPISTELSVTTQEGWIKKIHTNKQGIASLRFIKDREGKPKDRRLSEKYIFSVEHKEKSSKLTYKTTYVLDIYPTPREWQSRSMGYLTALAAMMVVVVITAIKRRKRI